MPKIRIYKTENGITCFGKYLTIVEFKKLKEILIEYFKKINL
jgi:hypothetical protein